MAEKVFFDPVNKLILVTATPDASGNIDINFQQDVYSDGKEDWIVSGTLNKLKFPIRGVGGDAVSATKNLGATFFLQYGWRIIPYEGNQRLRIEGNVYTDPFGDYIVYPTSGSYSILIENTVSDLTSVDTVTINATGSSGATAAEIAAAVWNDTASLYTDTSSFGYILVNATQSVYIASSSISTIVNSVWNENLSSYSLDTAGYILLNNTASFDATELAAAVWNDTASLYADTSSFGYILVNATQSVYITSESISQMTNAVWDEQLSTYITAGSAGYSLSNVSAGANPSDIAAAVWNDTASLYTTTSSFGYIANQSDTNLQLILGLVQHNFRMTNQVYDANGNMTSAQVDIYPSSADADAETNSINTYYITAVYDGNNRLIDYKMIE